LSRFVPRRVVTVFSAAATVLAPRSQAFCIADVAVQATRPFFDSASESLVRSRAARHRRYVRGWLLPDLIVAVPARSLACAVGARLRPLQALKLLRCAYLVVEVRGVKCCHTA